jgi:OTU domain-containing protein 5
MDYMERERVFFSQFIDGSFDEYIRIKRRNGVWGDDPEIQAMCEIYNRPANIWSFDATHGARRLRTFHEGSVDPTPPIQLSYYGGGHYDSIISPTSFEGTIINAREAGQVEGLALERTLSGSGVAMRRATEGGEDEALRLALENSRRCFDAAIVNNDDLEHALNASLQDYESSAGLLGLCEQETKEGEATSSSSSSSSVPTDMVQAQEAMLQQAVQRSEQEQLERAMQASLQGQEEDPEVLRQQAEEEELRRAIEASMQEEAVGGEGAEMIDEEEELRRAIEASMQEETSPPIASMTMIPDEDEELRRVLMLSQMSEEEMIRRAIEESQQVDSGPILGPGAMEEDEESLLQAAIEASMQEEERGEEEEERGEQQEGEGQGEQQEGEEEG